MTSLEEIKSNETEEETKGNETAGTEGNETQEKKRSQGIFGRIPNFGLLLALCSSFTYSLSSLTVKVLAPISFIEILFFAFVTISVITVPSVIFEGKTFFPKGRITLLLILRSILGCFGFALNYYALHLMQLGDTTVIVHAAPVFVCIFARIFLKESCKFLNLGLIFLTMIGIILIVRPSFLFGSLENPVDWKGPIFAIISTLLSSNIYVVLRSLQDVHHSVTMAVFSVLASGMTSVIIIATHDVCCPKSYLDISLIIANGVLTYLGTFFKTIALRMEGAGPVSIVRTADIFFAFTWQYLIYKIVPDTVSIVGAILIVSCVFLLAIQKIIQLDILAKRLLAFFIK